MIGKTLHVTLDTLVVFSVWCAAVLFAVTVWYAVIAGISVAYHLIYN